MTIEISSNSQNVPGSAAVRAGTSPSPVGASSGSASATAEHKSYITPIPKAEIKVDLERQTENLREAISKLNDMMTAGARNVTFAMDEKLGRPIIYIKNATTGEIVRQLPNEVVVRIAHSIEDFKGLLHNEKI